MNYKDEETEVVTTVKQLVRLHGQHITWGLLAEYFGIQGPQAQPKVKQVKPEKIYLPCARCHQVLGNFAKGFCAPCYRKEKTKIMDLEGWELHPIYGTRGCSTCGTVEGKIYRLAGTDERCCKAHETQEKRDEYLRLVEENQHEKLQDSKL